MGVAAGSMRVTSATPAGTANAWLGDCPTPPLVAPVPFELLPSEPLPLDMFCLAMAHPDKQPHGRRLGRYGLHAPTAGRGRTPSDHLFRLRARNTNGRRLIVHPAGAASPAVAAARPAGGHTRKARRRDRHALQDPDPGRSADVPGPGRPVVRAQLPPAAGGDRLRGGCPVSYT